jgi:hypothetical protein
VAWRATYRLPAERDLHGIGSPRWRAGRHWFMSGQSQHSVPGVDRPFDPNWGSLIRESMELPRWCVSLNAVEAGVGGPGMVWELARAAASAGPPEVEQCAAPLETGGRRAPCHESHDDRPALPNSAWSGCFHHQNIIGAGTSFTIRRRQNIQRKSGQHNE